MSEGGGLYVDPFVFQETADIPIFIIKEWEERFPSLRVGFSARKKGEDADCRNYALHVGNNGAQVIENRRKLAEFVDFSLSDWTCAEQVHHTRIAFAQDHDRGRGKKDRKTAFQNTDGLFSYRSNMLLASYYADCVPLYFYASDIGHYGVAHAGWKGTVQQIGPKMIQKLQERGARIEHIFVAVGPSIGPCCYEVDHHVIHPLKRVLNNQMQLDRVAMSHTPAKWHLDLKEANASLLKNIGVKEQNVLQSNWCTSCDVNYFYSHRRDGGNTGRMVAWIGKKGD
nr:peptidoglycan editing factor PgeF [Polycladospora coralii]